MSCQGLDPKYWRHRRFYIDVQIENAGEANGAASRVVRVTTVLVSDYVRPIMLYRYVMTVYRWFYKSYARRNFIIN